METDRDIQNQIANLTHFVLAQITSEWDIDLEDFYVNHLNVSGALSIEQNLCSYSYVKSRKLKVAINEKDTDINNKIYQALSHRLYPNGTYSNTSVTITNAVILEFSVMIEVISLFYCLCVFQWSQCDCSCHRTMDPTEIPTTQPTAYPTSAPTISVCNGLYVVISDFDDITADTLNDNTTLQSIMANITHSAIVTSASTIGVDSGLFSVHFQNASDALSITFSLCTSTKVLINALMNVIDEYEVNITDAMESGLAEKFGSDSNSMTVTVSVTKFRLYSESV